MKVLGIETSCDELFEVALRNGVTSGAAELWAATGRDNRRAQGLYSQSPLHAQYGGVVPELASRDHVRKLLPLVRQVLDEAGLAVRDLDGVAYTAGPGLVGALLAARVVEALGAPAEAYGKAAIVGLDGEVEHGSALIHTLKFGDHFRTAAHATTLLPAVEKRAAAGTAFDIPLKHITDATIRSHHQTIEVRISDAPHAGEILIALAASAQGRPQQRLAALSTEQ